MIRIHPKLSQAAALVALAVSFSAGGCRTPQGGIVNPFLAPNRVPPPATRSLLPGQAQPYYPGDPLPVMQSGVDQPNANAAIASAEAPEMPSATEYLKWASPRGASAAPATTAAVAPQTTISQENAAPKQSVVASNEPSVAIPSDGDSLRFALPPQLPPEPQPFTPSGPVALASSQQPVPAPQQVPPTMSPQPQDIAQASYGAPVITNAESAVTSPWRSPQIAQQSVPATNYVAPMNPQPIVAQPIGQPLALAPPPLFPTSAMPQASVAHTMDVRLRAVPSPPDMMAPSMPRIRIPGYESGPPTIGRNDGFRPRTSMR
ncbi:MAG: hypothetical protein L0228_08360 [Planctomycetes bacterium]|nr:hypothetical protein [Planctomycetota bacterium]